MSIDVPLSRCSDSCCRRYCRCISCAGKEASDPDAGSENVFLIALAEENAPEETLDEWHLKLTDELPEAAKFWAYHSAEAKAVHFSLNIVVVGVFVVVLLLLLLSTLFFSLLLFWL
jgi:hypothetical protein